MKIITFHEAEKFKTQKLKRFIKTSNLKFTIFSFVRQNRQFMGKFSKQIMNFPKVLYGFYKQNCLVEFYLNFEDAPPSKKFHQFGCTKLKFRRNFW